MDERLKKALEFSNYRQTLNNQIHQLRISAQNKLVIGKNGGYFTIDRELISFVNMLINEEQESVVILDDNQIPVVIDDLEDFADELMDRYFKVTNEYSEAYKKVCKARKVTSIIDVLDE